MSKKTDKVLLITETPPGTPNGFGITLSTLFDRINHDVLYTDASFKPLVDNENYIHAQCPYHRSRKSFVLFATGLILEWRGNFSKLWLFLFLRKKYKIVYAFFYSLENAQLAEWIAKQKKSKLIIHVADHSHSFFDDNNFLKIVKSAHKCFCIGRNMRDKYESTFNRRFDVFHNLADDNHLPLPKVKKFTFDSRNIFKVLFLGSLFKTLHNGAINDVCTAVSDLRAEGHNIVLNLVGQIVPSDLLTEEINGTSVVHQGLSSPENRFNIMAQHHVFVVPASFKDEIAAEYCYSIPTKLPELMTCGRPSIIYGPKSMESHRFCTEYKSGHLINERSINSIKKMLLHLMENYEIELIKSSDDAVRLKPLLSKTSQISKFRDALFN